MIGLDHDLDHGRCRRENHRIPPQKRHKKENGRLPLRQTGDPLPLVPSFASTW